MGTTRSRRRIRVLTGALLLALVGLGPGVGSAAATSGPAGSPGSPGSLSSGSHHRQPRAVALGDSYASGEGLAPYLEGTDTATDRCHRSPRAYPRLLSTRRAHGFRRTTSVACSGAVTASVVTRLPTAPEPAQIDALSSSTRTVTLTIGGNDIGFAPVLQACVYTPVVEAQALVPGQRDCRLGLDAEVTARTAWLGGRPGATPYTGTVPLPQVLAAVHARAPRARILVTGYPRLFGLQFPTALGCPVGQVAGAPLYVAPDDVRWIRSKVAGLNDTIRGSVAAARSAGVDARYVDVASAFTSHNVCGSGRPWLNALVTTGTAVQPASFHPTARGQRAFARAVAAVAGGRSPRIW